MQEIEDVFSTHWYGLGRVLDIRPVDGEHGIHSANFVVSVLERSGRKRFVLKQARIEQAQRFERAFSLQWRCHDAGVSVPAIVARTDTNELIIQRDNRIWGVQEYCDGHNFKGEKREIKAVASSFALLQKTLRQLAKETPDDPLYADLTLSDIDSIKGMVLSTQKDEFNELVLRTLDDLPNTYQTFSPIESPAEFLMQSVHMDCHPKNVLFSDSCGATLLDFGNIFHLPRMLAVSFACHRFAGFTSSKVRAFMNAYTEIDHLAPKELELYPLFVAREAIRRVNYVLRSHFFQDDSRWDFELSRQLTIWREAMQHARIAVRS